MTKYHKKLSSKYAHNMFIFDCDLNEFTITEWHDTTAKQNTNVRIKICIPHSFFVGILSVISRIIKDVAIKTIILHTHLEQVFGSKAFARESNACSSV